MVVHGGPGFPSAYLEPELRPLALSRTLLLYDQRSAGESTLITDTARLGWRDHVDDLEALRRHFGLETMTLLGHSWGPIVVAGYALEHPERVERMILVDPSPPALEPYTKQFDPISRLDSLSLAKLERARSRWGETPDSVKQCWDFYAQFGEGYTSHPTYIRQAWGNVCDAPQATHFNPNRFHPLASLGEYDWTPELARLRIPTLIVHGEDDPLPVGGARQWADALPDVQLVVVEDAGHFPFFERPEVFFPVVEAFLEGEWPVPVEEAVGTWPPEPGATTNDYERAWWEITAAHDRVEAAIAAQDPDRAIEHYAEDAIFFAPTAPPLRGHRQIRAFFRSSFDKGVRSAEFQTLDLEGDAERRIEGGRYTLRGGDGRILDMGKYLVVWERVDGEWKAHRDIFNTTMEVPSPLYECDLPAVGLTP
ncbi:MAG: alpha/beta fold hydrolase [Gemmatimonadota bacterium]